MKRTVLAIMTLLISTSSFAASVKINGAEAVAITAVELSSNGSVIVFYNHGNKNLTVGPQQVSGLGLDRLKLLETLTDYDNDSVLACETTKANPGYCIVQSISRSSSYSSK